MYKIRNESATDYAKIYEVNRLAFGEEDEAKLVNKLRADADAIISLAAEINGKIVGHLLMSKMYISTANGDIPALALAPVAVVPDFQKQGIGSALIKQALEIVPEKGENIVLVLGHKEYYPKFGFSKELVKNIGHPFNKESFMGLELKTGALKGITGKVKYPSAFGLEPKWTKQYLPAGEVINLYKEIERIGIQIWLDGGWAVDALLGRQTRPHKDLDIAMEWKDVPKLREFFSAKGYKEIRQDSKWNFVLGNADGNEIDVHAFVYDNQGNIADGIMYPKESLTGTGTIAGHTIKCISAKYMVEFLAPWIDKHPYKYLPAVSALCQKFEIPLPEEYNNFKQ